MEIERKYVKRVSSNKVHHLNSSVNIVVQLCKFRVILLGVLAEL